MPTTIGLFLNNKIYKFFLLVLFSNSLIFKKISYRISCTGESP